MSARSVARLLAPVLARVVVVAAAMTLVAIVGVIASTAAIDELDRELHPAAAANQDSYQDLLAMSAAVESWSSTGLQAAVDRYHQASLSLAAHQQEVRDFAAGDRTLTVLVEAQEQAATAWLRGYAAPRMATEGREPATAREARRGGDRFDAVRTTHQETAQEIDRRIRLAMTGVGWRLKGTALAVLAVGLVGTAVVVRSRRRMMTEISQPLLELERAVQRMVRNEPDVRAPLRGPKEIQAIAAAVNDLADAQARAKAVEVWIQRELRTLDTAKDDFVSNVSHELRTPLTTISGYLELVAEEFDGQMEPRHERILEATRRNVARLRSLIDDLLTLSKAEARTSQMESIDLVALVREVVTDVRLTAARRGIDIDVRVPDGLIPVRADRAMLHRAFVNIVSNAVKFSHDDTRVEIVVEPDGDQAVVRVVDHGIGIPAAELDRLGTRFFRASNAVTNEIAGTGLGVRIMQTIIDGHSGAVRIESEEGRGTTVSVRLPREERETPVVATIPVPRRSEVESEPVPEPQSGPEADPGSGPGDPGHPPAALPKIVPAFSPGEQS